MTVLTGQDSVGASGMTAGHDVYGGYGGRSSFSNMSAVYARFPGKQYIVFDTHVSQVDCYDVETGGGSASEAPAFFRQWVKVHLNKPSFYANASTIGSVTGALTAAGISRSKYYLIVAKWDNDPSIPAGYDGKQYASGQHYDSDSFESYMWTAVSPAPPPPPANPWPLALGSSGANVLMAQRGLNKWRYASPLLTTDGSFGVKTEVAVKNAQEKLKLPVTGVIDETLWKDLLADPTVTPVPPPPPVPKSGTQEDWRWCDKCQGLFFGPFAAKSHCPAGGAHVPGTWNYSLSWKTP